MTDEETQIAEETEEVEQVEDEEPTDDATPESELGDVIKLVTLARIKDFKVTSDGVKLNLDGLDYTTSQIRDLASILREKLLLEVTIKTLPVSVPKEEPDPQGNLFDEPGDEELGDDGEEPEEPGENEETEE